MSLNTERSLELEPSAELRKVIEIAEHAGEILIKHHKTSLDVAYKQDQFDPVTLADRESDAYLREALAAVFPDDEILSEESAERPKSYDGRVWMVDPLDDTKGFIAGRDTPSVIIGLLENHQPKLGLVYLPFRNELYFAELGKGSFHVVGGVTTQNHVGNVTTIEQARHVTRNQTPGDNRPIEEAISRLGFAAEIPEGSIGTKIGLVARDEADCFIHTNLKACKWDTLGSQIILTEAGGVISDLEGNPLDYEKPDVDWDKYFVAASTDELRQAIVEKLKATL